MQQRRTISLVILVIVGLVLGFLMKRVGLGLLIGLVLGLLANGMMDKGRK